ncbi:hypothetical protein AGMMS50249_7660 [candidate division SR1 bacterium]|nr:hypothetical protein AGMMS50249_7660 [candidate division SR1 bacterium]
MINSKINILYCLDETRKDYARHLGVSLLSLLDTNRENQLNIYILSAKLSGENKAELERLVADYGQKITIYLGEHIIPEDIEKLLIRKDIYYSRPLAMFYRIFWWNVFPDITDRILYLDCDTMVLKDLKQFYNTDFGDASIVGAKDCPATDYERKLHLKLKTYINSGVLLMNRKIIDTNWANEVKKVNEGYKNLIKFPDMDYINIIFQDKIKVVGNENNRLLTGERKFDWNNTTIIHTIKKPRVSPSLQPKSVVKLYNSYLTQTKWKSYIKQQKATVKSYLLRLFEKISVGLISLGYKLGKDRGAYLGASFCDAIFGILLWLKKKVKK